MKEDDRDEYVFLTQTIKDRPLNKRKVIEKLLLSAACGIVFGLLAAFCFLNVYKKAVPTEEPSLVQIPSEDEGNEISSNGISDGNSDEVVRASDSDANIGDHGSVSQEGISQEINSGNGVERTGKGLHEEAGTTGLDNTEEDGILDLDEDTRQSGIAAASGREEAPTNNGDKETDSGSEKDGDAVTVSSSQLSAAEQELAPADYIKLYKSLKDLSVEAAKSIVMVSATKSDMDWFENIYENTNHTSGLIVANNGIELLILVAYKPFDETDQIKVTFCDGESAEGQVKQRDSDTGLQVISVRMDEIDEETMETIKEAELGTSRPNYIVGEPVMAIGSPYGQMESVGYGMVVSNNVELSKIDRNLHVIGTDIYGSSSASGVIVDYQGKVLGLISLDTSDSNARNLITGYAISDIKDSIEKLSNGKTQAVLGVYGSDVPEEIHEEIGVPFGAYVSKIEMDSPAMRYGIMSGDVITRIGTQEVSDFKKLTEILMGSQSGDETVVTVQRYSRGGYSEMTFEVTLG